MSGDKSATERAEVDSNRSGSKDNVNSNGPPEGRPEKNPKRPDEDDGTVPPEEPPTVYGEWVLDIDRPLIFVPGIMGSTLSTPRADLNLPPEPFWPPRGLDVSGTLDRLTGPGERYAGGLFPGVYEPLLQWFELIGYERGVTFWPFPYDWTQSNRISGAQLAAFIQSILDEHPEWDDVDIVCHSMGGLVTRAAYRLAGAADQIARIAYLASPHYGAPKAYFVLHPEIGIYGGGISGFFKELITEGAWDFAFREPGDSASFEDQLKDTARDLQSVYELLPDEYYLDTERWMVEVEEYAYGVLTERRQIHGPTSTYFTNDESQLPDNTHTYVRKALAFKRALTEAIPPGGEEHTLIIYGEMRTTLDTVERNAHLYSSGFETPVDSGQGGDGTVPTESARAELDAGDPRLVRINDEHSTLATNDQTLLALHRFLGNSNG